MNEPIRIIPEHKKYCYPARQRIKMKIYCISIINFYNISQLVLPCRQGSMQVLTLSGIKCFTKNTSDQPGWKVNNVFPTLWQHKHEELMQSRARNLQTFRYIAAIFFYTSIIKYAFKLDQSHTNRCVINCITCNLFLDNPRSIIYLLQLLFVKQ